MKGIRIGYLVVTILFSIMMLMSAGMYLFDHAKASEIFASLGYPTNIIYPLAMAKILGVLTIWLRRSHTLVEWVYAGFFFDFLLALQAHLVAQDGDFMAAVLALVLLLVSYGLGKKRFANA